LFATLRSEIRRLDTANVRHAVYWRSQGVFTALQDYIVEGRATHRRQYRLTLVIAANYGGRWDVAQAARRVAEADVAAGRLQLVDITPGEFHRYTCLADLPEPDLFIRTGGEQRISNFLLWQLAYTELYFSDGLWPDYDADDLEMACAAFASRQRRFGQTAEQVARIGHA
jgi:undecaprenyl diphosphate synthase